ncbi:MAG: thiosulfate oxidation carrier protein SoxY [Chloroflexota bacterium]
MYRDVMLEGAVSRRGLLRAAVGAGLGAVVWATLGPGGRALAIDYPLKFFREVKDPQNPTPLEKEHLITFRAPVIAEDGANLPVVAFLENHPMEPGHHIRSMQFLNFNDPVVSKGVYHLSPANGQAYLSLQIRSDGGDADIFVIADCTKHGKWFASKKVKVSLGGC